MTDLEQQLKANIANATATEAPAPANATPGKPKANASKPKATAPKALPTAAISGKSVVYDPENQKQPPRPGTPCQVKGCPGRYSTLQSRKTATGLVRELICRTCQTRPEEPTPAAPTVPAKTAAKPAKASK